MKKSLKIAVGAVAALVVSACSAGSPSAPPAVGVVGLQAAHVPMWLATHSARAACPGSRIGQAQCDVLVNAEQAGPDTIAGWTAPELEAAYNLPSSKDGTGQSVYIVDAYDNPNVATDLATYRSAMGLPKAKFNKYNQTGQMKNYPPGNKGWGLEIDLDVEMVSASCPNCTINLVEANDNYFNNIDAAEAEAVKLGATIISNSFSGSGDSESAYDTPGVTYVASSGDGGYGLYQPATYKDVIAVGGTILNKASGKRGYTEVVWPSSGGGCSSTAEPKPSWQKDPDCTYRTGSDVSAVAYLAAEYDSYQYGGWIEVQGTSIGSPLTAGIVGLAANSTKQTGGENIWTLSKKHLKRRFYAVKSGNDGSCTPPGSYLCTAGTKQFGQFSGPTGWGTPHGIKAY